MISTLTVFSGPMFAGKTTSLIGAVNAAVDQDGAAVVIVKPAMDNRYAENAIVTHDGVAHMAVPVACAGDVFAAVAAAAGDGGRAVHVFADEVQFLERPHFDGDFHLVVHALLLAGCAVTCGGLDSDWRGLPFDVTARLLAMADHVTKLTARCAVTGLPAQKTYKKVADGARVALGAGDTYEARSNLAWEGEERAPAADRCDRRRRPMIAAIASVLDLVGVAVFAVTGALVASRKQMDIVGFAFLGTVTGIGGGTVRDLVLGQTPVFWVREPVYLLICVGCSVFVFAAAHVPRSRLVWLMWLDAVGMALFCVLGAEKALPHGPVVAATMGVVTAVMGGMIRDILGGESPVILRREVYATAALAGALTYLLALLVLPRDPALLLGFCAALALRGLALRNRWSLPVYRPREARRPEDVGL
jgi:uncharacterized membrane protein YeiH/thymidine kinase